MTKGYRIKFAVPLIVVMFATGCAATPTTPVKEPVVQSQETTPAPSETKEPELVTGAPGDVITPSEAKQLNGQRGTLRPYEMKDGTFVILDVKQPLPAPVKQEVIENLGSVGNDTGSALRAMTNKSERVGKTIVMVRYLQTSTYDGHNVSLWCVASYANGLPIGIQSDTAEGAVAQIQPWIDSQNDPYL